jgi:hypothetical protein
MTLNDIIAYAQTAGIVMQFIVNSFIILAELIRPVALRILEMIDGFNDLFDKKREEGIEVPVEEKRAATEVVVSTVLEEFHGSGNLVSESIVRAMVGLGVYIMNGMRYGEDVARNEEAQLHGYMGKGPDLERAAATHAGFKVFGF